MKEYTNMDEQKDETNLLRGAFPRSFRDIKEVHPKGASSKVYETPGQYYAIASDDEVVKRFKLILRTGRIYSVSYSLLPVFILLEGKELIIKTYGVHVIIKGRNLDPIEEYLSNEMLIWIKESMSGKDGGKTNAFVSEILIRGKAMKHEEEPQNEDV